MAPKKNIAAVAVGVPLLLFATTYAAFQAGVIKLGPVDGYLAAFSFYWLAWCIALPMWLLGVSGLSRLFSSPAPTLKPRRRTPPTKTYGIPLMVWGPVVFAFATIFPKTFTLNPRVIAISVVLSIVNGIAEEVLWRGVFLRVLPAKAPLSWVFTTLAYGVWHLAPCAIYPDAGPGGNLGLVISASGIGLLWGLASQWTGSIKATALAHVALNLAGGGPVAVLAPMLAARLA